MSKIALKEGISYATEVKSGDCFFFPTRTDLELAQRWGSVEDVLSAITLTTLPVQRHHVYYISEHRQYGQTVKENTMILSTSAIPLKQQAIEVTHEASPVPKSGFLTINCSGARVLFQESRP
jgi:hypothetical protein